MKAVATKFVPVVFNGLPELFDQFKNPDICAAYLKRMRWQHGYYCPHCGVMQEPYLLKSGYKCSEPGCGKKFSDLKGTIFENTKISLRLWFAATYLMVSRSYGISSAQLAKDLVITQKTAWFLLHRIREVFNLPYASLPYKKLTDIVEVDETFLGGKTSNRPWGRRKDRTQGRSLVSKTAVFGALQRGGELRAAVVPDTSGATLKTMITAWVSRDALIMSDEWKGYSWVSTMYRHLQVQHKKKEMTYMEAHLNGIEGAWANLKRRWAMLHSIDRKYLQRIVDEFVWSYNHRQLSSQERFHRVLEMACNKRISLEQLRRSAPPMPNRETNYLFAIQHAVDKMRILEIEYINNNKEKSLRKVEPVGLAIYKDNWHMIAWCHKRKDYRDFKVLRITRLKDTGKPFAHYDHPNLVQYLKRNSLPYSFKEYRQTG